MFEHYEHTFIEQFDAVADVTLGKERNKTEPKTDVSQ